MCKLTNNNFTFVATERIPQERLDMGYADMNEAYPFVLRAYESEEAEHKAEKLALESDAIITGSAPEKYTVARVEQHKLTFRYSERVYKRGYGELYLRQEAGLCTKSIRYIGKSRFTCYAQVLIQRWILLFKGRILTRPSNGAISRRLSDMRLLN